MRKQPTLFILPLLFAFISNAQNLVEIKSKRDMFTKVYDKGNGQNEAIISGGPVHYLKNGVWEDINTFLRANGNVYQNEDNAIRSYFPKTNGNSDKIKLAVNTNDELFIGSGKNLVVLNDLGQLNAISFGYPGLTPSVAANAISYPQGSNGVTDVFKVGSGEIKNSVVFNAAPALIKNFPSNYYFGFQENLELPEGWRIITADNSSYTLTSSSLVIKDASNKTVANIPAPIFFDNYGPNTDGSSSVQGKYAVVHEENDWIISTVVPIQWLKDPGTKYPLTLDPTIVLVGNTGGWQSPNNWVDNPGFVFIGVCCGNLTHRAWIKFSLAGIPTTSCITLVEIQPNVTTVANTTAELTYINDVTGAFGPYGGIVPAAYNDFGTGNYTSFTIVNTGLYGYYTLGPSACSLMQAQLGGGWFQTAFQFNNEPSVNYKIITATSSNLRVTYGPPPCPVVLPIELKSFNAVCKRGTVRIDWETVSEENNDHFTVERTADGVTYETMATIKGAGNSNKNNSYSYIDAKPLAGTSYYALKQTDRNGRTKILNLASVNCEERKEISIHPNPNNGTFTIDGVEADEEIIITDVYGQIVYQTKVSKQSNSVGLNDNLSGVYFIKVISEKGISSKRIVINK